MGLYKQVADQTQIPLCNAVIEAADKCGIIDRMNILLLRPSFFLLLSTLGLAFTAHSAKVHAATVPTGMAWVAASEHYSQQKKKSTPKSAGKASKKAQAAPLLAPSNLDAQSFSDLFTSSILLQRGQIPQGFALMQRAALRTQDPELLKQIVRVAISVGRPELGRGALRGLLRQSPYNQEVLEFALQLMDPSQPDFEQAVKNHLNREPKSALRVDFAQRLMAQKRLLEAQSELQAAVKNKDQDAKAWFLLASLYSEEENLSAAQAAFEKVLSIVGPVATVRQEDKPTDAQSVQGAGAATQDAVMARLQAQLQAQGKLSQEALYREQAQTQLLQIFVKTKQNQKAEALLAQLPRANAEQRDAAERLERAFWSETGQWQRVYDALDTQNKRQLAAKAPDVDSLYEQAIAAEKIGRVDDMERLFRLIMEVDPEHYNAPNALGYSWVERGIRLDEARVLIQRALKLSPQSGYIWDSLGWLEFKAGNFAKAVQDLQKAYALQPDPEIGAHLGEALWASGKQEEARKIWLESLKMDREHAVLRSTLQRLDPKLAERVKP